MLIYLYVLLEYVLDGAADELSYTDVVEVGKSLVLGETFGDLTQVSEMDMGEVLNIKFWNLCLTKF